MSFLDNPLVGAIGQAMVKANPNGAIASIASALPKDFAPEMQATAPPAPLKSEVSKPPVADNRVESTRESMAVRQHYPTAQAKGPAAPKGMPVGMNMPGVMSPEVLQHPAVQQLLSQYGVSPEQANDAAQSASPNLFITNPAAYQKHPVLAGMIERGLEGAAFTKGSHTIGEGISNIAQGVLDSNAARAEKYNNQLMMPFAQAQQVAGLKSISDEQAFKVAQAKHYQDLEDHYQDMDKTNAAYKEALAGIGRDRESIARERENLLRRGTNLKYLRDPAFSSLKPEDAQAFNDAIKEHGGDLLDMPTDLLESYAVKGQTEADARKTARATTVARINAAGRIGAASTEKSLAGPALDLKAMQDQLPVATREYNDFTNGLTRYGMVSYGGKSYARGTPEANAISQQLKSQVEMITDKINHFGRNVDPNLGAIATPDKMAPKKTSGPKPLVYGQDFH